MNLHYLCKLKTNFKASSGSLQCDILRCFKLRVLVKNCLKDGGTSLFFLVVNTFREAFSVVKLVAQPWSRALNSASSIQSVPEMSR